MLTNRRKKNLNDELLKMKQLAGLISESEENVEYAKARLSAIVGMVLKLDGKTKSEVVELDIPKEPHGVKMTKIPTDMLHITLTGVRNFRIIQDKAKELGFSIPMFIQNIIYYIDYPKIEFGEVKFVYRGENGDGVYSPNGKVSYVLAIKNQEDFRNYVNEIYNELGLENLEPNRFYHITLANNADGDPLKSIGDVNNKDFK